MRCQVLPMILLLSLGLSVPALAAPDASSTQDYASALTEEQSISSSLSEEDMLSDDELLQAYYAGTGDESLDAEVTEDPALHLSYNASTQRYTYTLPDQSSFSLSIPNTAVTTQPVQLLLPDNMQIESCQQDGVSIYQESNSFKDAATYDLTILSIGEGSVDESNPSEVKMGENYRFHLHFQICDNINNLLEYVQAPEDFVLSAVTRNGVRQTVEKNHYFLPGDGSYVFEFRSEEGNLPYELRYTFDATAPRLSFIGLDAENVGRGRIQVRSPEICTTEVMHGSETYNLKQNSQEKIEDSLSGVGVFRLTAQDNAGNSRSYIVYIKSESQLPTFLKAVACLGLAGALILMMISRKTFIHYVR